MYVVFSAYKVSNLFKYFWAKNKIFTTYHPSIFIAQFLILIVQPCGGVGLYAGLLIRGYGIYGNFLNTNKVLFCTHSNAANMVIVSMLWITIPLVRITNIFQPLVGIFRKFFSTLFSVILCLVVSFYVNFHPLFI